MQGLLANLLEAFLQPRRSARRMQAAVVDWPNALLLALLALSLHVLLTVAVQYLLGAGPVSPTSLESLAPGAAPELAAESSGSGLPPFGPLVFLAVIIGLVFVIGRMFGGEAGLRDVVAVLSWYGVATAILIPVEVVWIHQLVTAGGSPLLLAFGVGLELFAMWILANFIAAVHGFRSAFRVLLCMVAGLVLLGLGLGLALRGG